jgi:hypothetical protein
MLLSAEIRVSFSLPEIQRLVAAGFLPAEADCPDDLHDALKLAVAALPMPPSATPNHGLRAG